MSQTTLKEILKAKRERAERADRPTVSWFSLTQGKNPVKIQFLQELETDAPNYDSNRGAALFLVEHASPQKFTHRALCTLESEGRCFACEMNQENPVVRVDGKDTRPWVQKTNLYVQVIDEDGKISVLSRPAFGSFAQAVYDYATEEGEGSITGQTFKIAKEAAKTAPWTLMPTKQAIEVPELPELVDLEAAVSFKVAYADQRKFYLPDGATEEQKEEKPAVSTIDW